MANRLSVTLSDDIVSMIDEISQREKISKADAIRRAFALLKVSVEQKQKGREIGIIAEDKDGGYKVVGTLVNV